MKAPSRELSVTDARGLLGSYHFSPGSLAEVTKRLGSVQYDPLNPMGRNPDLTLQSRIDSYRIDDWQQAAYRERTLYDAWDKQACLVPLDDWPYRRIYHRAKYERWRKRIFDPYPEAVSAALDELERRGPLSTAEFADQRSVADWSGSWYGPKLIKNVLRALWDSGRVVTHHRVHGRHVYDLPQRVIPADLLRAEEVDRDSSIDFLISRRVQSAGLLRPGAGSDLWYIPCTAAERRRGIERLLARGELVLLGIGGDRYLARPELLAHSAAGAERMRFVAPLDPLLWDRRGLEQLFGFRYVWEVYKPESQRTWGYYVLPVWWRDRFIGRFDGRLEGATFVLKSWWWEPDVVPDDALGEALQRAFREFLDYLGADGAELERRRVPDEVRCALGAAA